MRSSRSRKALSPWWTTSSRLCYGRGQKQQQRRESLHQGNTTMALQPNDRALVHSRALAVLMEEGLLPSCPPSRSLDLSSSQPSDREVSLLVQPASSPRHRETASSVDSLVTEPAPAPTPNGNEGTVPDATSAQLPSSFRFPLLQSEREAIAYWQFHLPSSKRWLREPVSSQGSVLGPSAQQPASREAHSPQAQPGRQLVHAKFNGQMATLRALAGHSGLERELETSRRLLGNTLARSTRETYEAAWNRFVAWSREFELDQDPPSFALYLARLAEGKSAALLAGTLSAYHFHKSDVFEKHPKWQELCFAMVHGHRRSSSVRSTKVASQAEAEQLVEVAARFPAWSVERRARAVRLVSLLYGGLLRVSESVAVTWEDCTVVDQEVALTIQKSKTDQSGAGARVAFKLPRSVLPAWKPSSGRILPSSDGSAWSTGAANSELRRLCKEAGVRRLSAHAFRRGGATSVAAKGVQPQVLLALGRWKSAQSTLPYIRPSVSTLANSSAWA